MLYLVEGTIVRIPYSGNPLPSHESVTRLVKADCLADAEYKFEKYFLAQDNPYSENVNVMSVKGYETIE